MISPPSGIEHEREEARTLMRQDKDQVGSALDGLEDVGYGDHVLRKSNSG